ncbi:hypothetical protein [Acidaminobacter sp.]|uniref:hypothetical protein n=1 Tax=Acidaminobacter sp. TaxID=1872102 RepID=UPI00137D00E7|nr:hypothetical protein [Acidaminobacter sp.]MDK9710591.1 hypothetical protein [Acidaminobacter sp.]MZQ96798.1 hypothetical protein [Acidaminobacter sp.]
MNQDSVIDYLRQRLVFLESWRLIYGLDQSAEESKSDQIDECLSQIDALDQRFNLSWMKNDSSSSAVLSELREANLKLMAEILTLHQGYQVMLNAKRQALIDEMREVKKARELSAQMRRTGGSEPGIFDKKV